MGFKSKGINFETGILHERVFRVEHKITDGVSTTFGQMYFCSNNFRMKTTNHVKFSYYVKVAIEPIIFRQMKSLFVIYN